MWYDEKLAGVKWKWGWKRWMKKHLVILCIGIFVQVPYELFELIIALLFLPTIKNKQMFFQA